MNKKQLKKVLDAINNKIKLSISEVSLTNDEIVDALSENDFLIPINIFVNPGNTTSLYKEITIYDKDYNTIYSKEDFDGRYNNPVSIDLFITQEIANNGIFIFVKCFDGELLYMTMNDNNLIENTDYEYINDEVDNINYIVISLTQVTGDIYMDIWGSPMPI